MTTVTTTASGLRAIGVTVRYPGVLALSGVSLELAPGEIHSLCGENGAGKSTLIRCLGGAARPTEGTVTIDGAPLPALVHAVEEAGVAVIHQEPLAFPDLTVEDTIFVGREPMRARLVWIDRKRMRERARGLIASLGESIDPKAVVGRLALAQRQMVAIARALATNCRYLILDEPTASLSAREATTLHTLMRSLRSRDVGVLFVSHRLEEVLELSDRVTVLRDGQHVVTQPAAGLTRAELVRQMVGREVKEGRGTAKSASAGPVRLSVKGLSQRGVFENVEFHARSGEIVGLAGLVGAGRSEIVRAIAGIDQPDEGSVLVDGEPLMLGRVSRAVDAGVVLVPEDRREQGLVLAMSIASNIGMSDPPGVTRGGLVNKAEESGLAASSVERLKIKTSSIAAGAGTLSGGNQQKVLLAKWLAHNPKVLIVDEPTRGVDVGGKSEIHAILRSMAQEGAAVVVVSSDLPELLALADRVYVVRTGRIVGELDGDTATPDAVIHLATPVGAAS